MTQYFGAAKEMRARAALPYTLWQPNSDVTRTFCVGWQLRFGLMSRRAVAKCYLKSFIRKIGVLLQECAFSDYWLTTSWQAESGTRPGMRLVMCHPSCRRPASQLIPLLIFRLPFQCRPSKCELMDISRIHSYLRFREGSWSFLGWRTSFTFISPGWSL